MLLSILHIIRGLLVSVPRLVRGPPFLGISITRSFPGNPINLVLFLHKYLKNSIEQGKTFPRVCGEAGRKRDPKLLHERLSLLTSKEMH